MCRVLLISLGISVWCSGGKRHLFLKVCSQSITDALVSAGKKIGVEYFINSEVDKVLIENSKAKGIKLLDGTEIEAKQMVVSDNATPQLFLRMIGEEHLTRKMKLKVDSVFFDRAATFLGTRSGA